MALHSPRVAIHGSSNATPAGILYNFETVAVDCSWIEDTQAERVDRLSALFLELWDGRSPGALTLSVPGGLRVAGQVQVGDMPPTEEDFRRAVEPDENAGHYSVDRIHGVALSKPRLSIPPELDWKSGAFAHQGRAVSAWQENGGRGILAMATGSGKTLTALIAAAHQQEESGSLLIIIAVPYIPLLEQRMEDCHRFHPHPISLSGRNRDERRALLSDAKRRLELGASYCEVVIVSHDFLVSGECREFLSALDPDVPLLLIADEVHNLGRPSFVHDPIESFEYRLGLSATPELQYDTSRSDSLLEYFGGIVFEYGLSEAIGKSLVSYNYYVHPVMLGEDEEEEWLILTERLRRMGFGGSESTAQDLEADVLSLLVRRRAILEGAREKVPELLKVLRSKPVGRTLVYCTDKRPEQLKAVNRSLMSAGYNVRQITSEETQQPRLAGEILADFSQGVYQILTSKRVLDEGVDLPAVETAHLLANSSVRRQWVQRLGCVLRRDATSPAKHAHVHDYLALPSSPGTPEGAQS